MILKTPSFTDLPHYVDALQRGWSPDTLRDDARLEQLREIESDPESFLASLDDREAQGPPIRLPDGSLARRLPGFHRWIWDGEFCGSINLRWQPGTPELPPTCPGHIGYAVVPWKRRKGYATLALRLMLPDAWAVGLPYVEVEPGAHNDASRRVIVANGGVLVERFRQHQAYDATESMRFRIYAPLQQ